jgi:hypothetical protein
VNRLVVLFSLGFLVAITAVSRPVRVSSDSLNRLREGRLWSKEDRVAFSARDLDELTHTSSFRRALDLGDPADSAREKLAKRRKRKRRARGKQAKHLHAF